MIQIKDTLSNEAQPAIVNPMLSAAASTNVPTKHEPFFLKIFVRWQILFLSWLLHRANRETKSSYFYTIKNKILKKYAKHLGYDVQFIEGKKCHSCNGTGIFHGYHWSGDEYFDNCYRCHRGWYKRPVWNILEKVQFGKYIFHQPYQRAYEKPDISTPIIEGYIEHNRAKFGGISLHILYLMYEKGYIGRYWRSSGIGWYVYWHYPQNWIPNLIHIIKKGKNSIPFCSLKRKIEKMFEKPQPKVEYTPSNIDDDDLPF